MPRPRVLLLEEIHPQALAWLQERATVLVATDLTAAGLRPLVADVDGIVIRGRGRITGALLERAPRLRVVGRHGVGLDNVDVEACTRRGIWVVYTPLAAVEAVAEHAVGLLLAVARHLASGDRAVRAGEFDAARAGLVGRNLHGQTLGIIGLGRIGERVAEICRAAFAMPVVFCDLEPREDAAARLDARRLPLAELLAASDIVSVHVPLTPQTRHLIDAAALARMRPGAILVNTARGGVIDEVALVAALRAGRLAAGLDVFDHEPLPADHPLAALPNVVLSPHRASHTEEALLAMGMVVEDVLRVLRGDLPRYPANRPQTEVSR